MSREHSITGSISPYAPLSMNRTHIKLHLSVSGGNRPNGPRSSGPSNDTRQFLTGNPPNAGKFRRIP